MPTKQPGTPNAAHETEERQQRQAVIGRHLMDALGEPDDPHAVQVRWLWDNYYRVNVYIGQNLASARIASSFFLVTDGDGNIVESTPKLTRRY